MSAFFVGSDTVDAAVTAIIRAGVLMSLDEANAIGRGLWTLNADAVTARYGARGEDMNGTPEEIAAYRWTHRNEATPVLFKSLECLLYQCSEGDVPQRELFQKVDAIREKLERLGMKAAPEYEAAPWGLCA